MHEIHNIILSARSEVFKSMIQNPMKEAHKGQVEITDFSPDVIETLLAFMYKNIVDEKEINVEVLKAADKYLVKGLKNACIHHMEANLSVEKALEIIAAAYLIDCQGPSCDVGGYYKVDPEKADIAMRPSKIFNDLMDKY